MRPGTKHILAFLFLALLVTGPLGAVSAWADPTEKLGPDSSLYQRVRALGHAGLLDAKDAGTLDEGIPVTRLQLAFYVEKARTRLQAPPPYTPQPTPTEIVAATEVPTNVPTPVAKKRRKKAAPTAIPTSAPTQAPTAAATDIPTEIPTEAPTEAPTQAPIAVPAVTEAPTAVPAVVPAVTEAPTTLPVEEPEAKTPVATPAAPAVVEPAAPVSAPSTEAAKKEIEDLLRELRQEDALLKNRLRRDERLAARRADEQKRLKPLVEDWDKAYRKSDRSSGSAHLDFETDARFENIDVQGITQVGAYRSVEEFKMGVYGDLGGKGTVSTGIGALLDTTNATAGPASIYLINPKITYNLDGKLGHWENTLTQEDYLGDTDLGTFARGTDVSTRFELPFEIKNYSEDKNQKCWDDYINNLGYVASVQTFSSGSSSTRVFNGLLMKGSDLPLVGKDARLTLLFGPTGTNGRRWEEGGKFGRTWLRGKVNTNLSALWTNDHYGDHNLPSWNMKAYQAEVGLDVLPVFMDIEAATSGFHTGVDQQATGALKTQWDQALQGTLSYYPFSFYGHWIGPDFSNDQSKVTIDGIDYVRYGITGSPTVSGSSSATSTTKFGYVGLADSLVSNRYGGRINLGWKGRQSTWMKGWPSFLDAVVVNADYALKREDRSMADPDLGNNALTVDWLVTTYYPDDTGLWGSSLFAGYGGFHPIGTDFFGNIATARSGVEKISPGKGMIEWIPLMAWVNGGSGTGHWVNLTHQKTYNYFTGTLKVQFNKWLNVSRPIYGGFLFVDNQVSGSTTDAALASLPDVRRPGATLAKIPDLFEQQAFDASLMVQALPNVNVMGDYGRETWTSQYTCPSLDRTTKSVGVGLAYDFPWGGGKVELRYKHLTFKDACVTANNYEANQTFAMFLFKF